MEDSVYNTRKVVWTNNNVFFVWQTYDILDNNELWDLINTGEVTSFVNDILVKTEEEERYYKVVKEIVVRHSLY